MTAMLMPEYLDKSEGIPVKWGKKRYKEQFYIDIDFETRSLGDIRALGAMKYCEHPSTQVLMISWKIEGDPTHYHWNPYTSRSKRPVSLFKALKRKGAFIRAFHSEFEYWVWNIVCARQFDWAPVPIDRFYDVMGQSCAAAMPASLEASAIACKAKFKKNEDGKALIKFFCQPIKDTEEFRHPLDFLDQFKKFMRYCDDDVRAQIAICKKTLELSPEEQNIMYLTETMNIRGIPIDVDFVHGALNMVRIAQRRMDRRARKIQRETGTEGSFDSLSQRQKVLDWVNARGCVIENMQKENIQNWLNGGLIDDELTEEVLRMRLQHAKSSTAKYKTMQLQTDNHGFIHGFLKYFIARTGRWGGRGMQIQNFPKPGKALPPIPYDKFDETLERIATAVKEEDTEWLLNYHPDIMEILAGYLRSAICAPEGYQFISADYSQIEARIVLWVAGSKNGIKDFGGEGKVYEAMASTIYDKPASLITKDSIERFIGKQTVLGAGFGMGAKKFVTSCWDVAQVVVEDAVGKKAIDGYRKRYHEVPTLWKDAEATAIKAMQFPGQVMKLNKHIAYVKRGKHLYCQLPSGRELRYPFAILKDELYYGKPRPKLFYEGKCSFSQKWKLLDTWGGKLVENFVQAMARDVMANGMKTAEKAGYPTCFSVHDEAAALVKLGFGSVKAYEKLLCILPKWAIGCPIAAEGWQGKRYRK